MDQVAAQDRGVPAVQRNARPAWLEIAAELVLLFVLALLYAPNLLSGSFAEGLASPVIIWLAILLTGLAQWLVAYMVGMGRLVRVWSGAMLMFSGKLAILISAGWLPFVLAFPAFPLFFALALGGLQTRRILLAPLCSVVLTLPLLLGNAYYWIYLVIGALVVAIIYGFDINAKSWNLTGNGANARFLGSVALGAALLVAVRLYLPVTVLPSLSIDPNPIQSAWSGSQPANWALLNFLVPDQALYDLQMAVKPGPAVQTYAYLGLAPFLALFGVVPAYLRRRSRALVLFAMLFLVTLLIAGGNDPFLSRLHTIRGDWYFLSDPIYILALTSVAFITLAGFGIQYLLDSIRNWDYYLNFELAGTPDQPASQRSGLPLRWLIVGFILVLLLLFVQDLYAAHHVWMLPHPPLTQMPHD
ncbi:MAG: hypothetical protein WCF84_04755 [Anaerolineae bacterium]